MGYGNVRGLKILKKIEKGKKKFYVEYNGAIVSDAFKTRAQAIQSVEPIIYMIKKQRLQVEG